SGHANLGALKISSADQLKAMDGHGWEIASHGLRHIDLTTLDEATMVSQLSESRARLSELVGRPVVDLAYPYGACDQVVQRAAATAGYETGFLAVNNEPSSDRFAIPRRPVRGDEGIGIFR